MNNKLNEMQIATLTDEEVGNLMKFEKDINNMHKNEELYVMVLKK